MRQHNPTIKKAMLKALEASLGIVTVAAKNAGIDRSTHYQWLKDDPEYKAAVDSLEDMVIDFAESKLHKLIMDGDTSATIFFMKCKGKRRGYVERQEINHKGIETPPAIKLTAEDLMQVLKDEDEDE